MNWNWDPERLQATSSSEPGSTGVRQPPPKPASTEAKKKFKSGICRADGCRQPLRKARRLRTRDAFCDYHAKAHSFLLGSEPHRLCHRCKSPLPLEMFEGDRRLCLKHFHSRPSSHAAREGAGPGTSEKGQKRQHTAEEHGQSYYGKKVKEEKRRGKKEADKSEKTELTDEWPPMNEEMSKILQNVPFAAVSEDVSADEALNMLDNMFNADLDQGEHDNRSPLKIEQPSDMRPGSPEEMNYQQVFFGNAHKHQQKQQHEQQSENMMQGQADQEAGCTSLGMEDPFFRTIYFKLFEDGPESLPSELRDHIVDWIGRGPSMIFGHVRPGCVELSVDVAGVWENPCADFDGLFAGDSQVAKFFRSRNFRVHDGRTLSYFTAGGALAKRVDCHSLPCPRLFSCVIASRPTERSASFLMLGAYLSTPGQAQVLSVRSERGAVDIDIGESEDLDGVRAALSDTVDLSTVLPEKGVCQRLICQVCCASGLVSNSVLLIVAPSWAQSEANALTHPCYERLRGLIALCKPWEQAKKRLEAEVADMGFSRLASALRMDLLGGQLQSTRGLGVPLGKWQEIDVVPALTEVPSVLSS